MNQQPLHTNGAGGPHGAIPALVERDAAPAVVRQAGYPSAVIESAPYGTVEEGRISYLDYWHIVVKRRWLILGVLGVCLAFGLYKSLSATPMYTATATLQIDPQAAVIIEGGEVTPECPRLGFSPDPACNSEEQGSGEGGATQAQPHERHECGRQEFLALCPAHGQDHRSSARCWAERTVERGAETAPDANVTALRASPIERAGRLE